MCPSAASEVGLKSSQTVTSIKASCHASSLPTHAVTSRTPPRPRVSLKRKRKSLMDSVRSAHLHRTSLGFMPFVIGTAPALWSPRKTMRRMLLLPRPMAVPLRCRICRQRIRSTSWRRVFQFHINARTSTAYFFRWACVLHVERVKLLCVSGLICLLWCAS